MTREEAITRIKDHMSVHNICEERAVYITEALNMAISALQQPEIIRCKDCKKCVIEILCNDYWCDGKRVWEDHYCSFAERREE